MPRRWPVIIIGAGPAGLAVGACLHQHGIEALRLEREAQVGSTWRRHYDRLHLHTLKQFSTLPHHPWPDDVPTYPSRDEVVAYLTRYAERFPQPTRFGEEVWRAHRQQGRWHVETGSADYEGAALVVAAGYNRRPRRPVWPGQDAYEGTLIHSADYDNGKRWRGRRALVVGSGNSGAEIALDLWEQGATVHLCVRGPVHVTPREVMGVPAQITGILLSSLPPRLADRIALAALDRAVGDLSAYGLVRPELGPAELMKATGRVPLVDVGTVDLIKQGHIRVRPGIERFEPRGVVFVDGTRDDYDLVLLATGYRPALDDFLDGAAQLVDDRGYPRTIGAEADVPGLYFVGYKNRPVGLLNDIAADAQAIADHIARRPSSRRNPWLRSISGIRSLFPAS